MEKRLGEYIREKRQQRGQTQKTAANEIGVARSALASWERGLMPSVRGLFALADWASVKVDDLRPMIQF
jgi:transcriptional regulator with XRE-family HTH domain